MWPGGMIETPCLAAGFDGSPDFALRASDKGTDRLTNGKAWLKALLRARHWREVGVAADECVRFIQPHGSCLTKNPSVLFEELCRKLKSSALAASSFSWRVATAGQRRPSMILKLGLFTPQHRKHSSTFLSFVILLNIKFWLWCKIWYMFTRVHRSQAPHPTQKSFHHQLYIICLFVVYVFFRAIINL